jgi:hypothetical protein
MSAPQGTKNDEAIQAASTLVGYAQQLIQLYNAGTLFLAHNEARNYQDTWNSLPTASVTPDGKISSTPDTTPVPTNPIIGLNISSTDLATLVTHLNNLGTVMESGTPSPLGQLLSIIV